RSIAFPLFLIVFGQIGSISDPACSTPAVHRACCQRPVRLNMGNPSAILSMIERRAPHVVKRSTQNCGSTFESYCMNHGQCMLLVDVNEQHCQCEKGFYGPRCSKMEFVVQELGRSDSCHHFLCESADYRYKKNKCGRQQKRQGYKEVQIA
ncbi:hypothetical protein F7725_019157, partial [Dissostichus mawsoni]